MYTTATPRHEWKYEVSRAEYLAIRQRLRTLMRPDPHTNPDGTYRIRSIYFDDADDRALWEKRDGVRLREKYRIRWYNDDHSFIALERKRKIDALGYKESVVLRLIEAQAILDGDTAFLRTRPEPLCWDFLRETERGCRPRVTVSYRREPYLYAPGNVRVTFDSEIRTSLFHRAALSEIRGISATDTSEMMLMEVKYDAYLPQIIADLIQPSTLYRQAFSKYAACRKYG